MKDENSPSRNAWAMWGSRLTEWEDKIFMLIRKRPASGVTAFELRELYPNAVSHSTRLSNLVKAGKIVATDERRENPRTGVKCTVYKIR